MNGKGDKQRSGLTVKSRRNFDDINMLKPDEEWAYNFMEYDEENNIWIGFDESQSNEVCWGFNQRQCYERLLEYSRHL